MKITSQITCVGLLLAAATLTTSVEVEASSRSQENRIESRLSRLTEAMKETGIESFIDDSEESYLIGGWANGRRGTWVNGYRGGFANRHGGGGFVNRNPWRNGGFYNRNWRDGGRFYNRSPWRNGGFLNRF